MKIFAITSLEGHTVVTKANNKEDAARIMQNIFTKSGYWGYDPKKIREIIPTELIPDENLVLITHTVRVK